MNPEAWGVAPRDEWPPEVRDSFEAQPRKAFLTVDRGTHRDLYVHPDRVKPEPERTRP